MRFPLSASPPAPQASARDSARDTALDGLRGIAILLVYVFHYGGGLTSSTPPVRLFGYLTQAGWVGVDLFFALSGYLITGLFWADRASPHCLRNFYARRALRILPLYFGALILAAVVAAAVAELAGAPLRTLRPLLLYAGFLQNVPPFVQTALHYPPPLPLYHLWSLAVEEQFYLLWPLLLLACRSRRGAFRLSLISFFLCCELRNFVFNPGGPIHHASIMVWSTALPGRCGALALGSALALAPQASRKAIRRWAPLAVVLSAAGFVAVGAAEHGVLLNTPMNVVLGLPCAEILSAAVVAASAAEFASASSYRSLLSTRPLRALGRISYGVYVFHILLEPCFDRIGAAVTHTQHGMNYQLVRLLVAFPISVAVATLSYRMYERPFLRLRHRFGSS